MPDLKSPYPWFGGKSRVASDVWQALGDVSNYIEPFFGGGAVMLARPHTPKIETANDINAYVVNFWRATNADPDEVARYASDPVHELDLHARGDWLFYRPGVDVDFIEKIRSDPGYYDARSAGWWVWGQSSWIGDNWGKRKRSRPHLSDAGMGVNRQIPHLSGAGTGVNRQRPHLFPGTGVNRQLIGNAGDEWQDTDRRAAIREYMRQLRNRIAKVRFCCGDWTRVLGDSVTFKQGMTGIFFDPPYAVENRDTCYGLDDDRTVAHAVREWCIRNGGNPLLRIALCGYEEHNELAAHGWRVERWSTRGGYSNQSSRGNENRHREMLWFSPGCMQVQESLFGVAAHA